MSIELSDKSKLVYDQFMDDYRNKKEVDYHDVFELIGRGASMLSSLKTVNGKKLSLDQQRLFLGNLFETLVRDELNDFKDDPRIGSIIDTVMKIKTGVYEVDFGKKGLGCLPCSSVKLSAQK